MEPIEDKYLHRSEADWESVKAVLSRGQLSGTAQVVREYEEALAQTFQSSHAIAVSSGSAAIHAALRSVNVTPKSEVIVPAIAPLPTIFPISAVGAVPIAVDILPDTLDFDPEDLVRKITKRTCAAILVPLWGYPIDYHRTLSILANAGVPLIEDAAHAHGSRLGSRCVGTFGKIGCFSTHDRKLVSTGEGGFVLTSDPEIAEYIRSFVKLGNLKGDAWGVNYKLNALAAALGKVRLADLEKQIQTRTSNSRKIMQHIETSDDVAELGCPPNGIPNYYNLVLLLRRDGCASREKMHALAERGIRTDQIAFGYDVFYRRKAYADLRVSCPSAEDLVSRVIQIPVHPKITSEDINQIVTAIHAL